MFVLILISLFSGLVFLLKDSGESRRTVTSLAFRVGLSAFLLVLLAVSAFMGWMQPHSLNGEERRPEGAQVIERGALGN